MDMKDPGSVVAQVLTVLAIVGMLGYGVYDDTTDRTQGFPAIFGAPYPNTDTEWQVVSPMALDKLNELATSLNEKRAIRDKAYAEIARAKEFQHLSDAEQRALEATLNNSIVETTHARDVMAHACRITEDQLTLPGGGSFYAGHAPCDGGAHTPTSFTTAEMR
jgi:ClpP class serine protease